MSVSKRQTKSKAPDDACSDDLVNFEKVYALLPSDEIDKLDVETLALLEELNQKIDSVITKENSNAVDGQYVSSSTDDSMLTLVSSFWLYKVIRVHQRSGPTRIYTRFE